MQRKVIPIKNYLMVVLLFCLLIGLIYYLIVWYRVTDDYTKSLNNPFLATINVNELENYIIDNPDIIIYLADSYDNDIDFFEESFKNYIISNDLKKEFIYIDSRKIDDYSALDEYLSDDLKTKKIGIVNKNNILIVKDGKIVDILYKNSQTINISDVEIFLENNGVLDD
ncbi:MAG: hypothetical protein PHE54_04955 [Bacilli bacterium]|nr:hypothetical protein [Bacilli bacterium]